MDIVSRLLTFMETHGIGSTQFADACGIPRPTLSQILSGRNKKISDAVISKIHSAYPRMSVLWLLFGEGPMEIGANNAISAPQTGAQTPSRPSIHNAFTPSPTASEPDANEEADGMFGASDIREPLIFDDEEVENESAAESVAPGGENPVVTIPADGSKSIVNIMVFYSDNSYQSFVPR